MSVEFTFRIVGMVLLAAIGGYWGAYLGRMAGGPADLYAVVTGLLGALVGLILTPFMTTRPIRAVRALLGRVSAQTLFASLVGLITGLIVAALLSFPLSLLTPPLGQTMPFVGALIFGYLGVAVFVMRQGDIFAVFRSLIPPRGRHGREGEAGDDVERVVLLDTSVIIDGRIADIARTGFIPGTLLIPHFILNELQYIADSTDSLRRQRGRRGLEVLSDLQRDPSVLVRISDMDVEGAHAVDDKLIILAKQLRCPVLTNDYNLNKVADLQGVHILNVNELANAVKTVFLPGESLTVQIIQEGKEQGQGVGYLDDGTMIVVENGGEFLGDQVEVMVTKVLQTAAGRMIFARPEV
jgi:uncharacterized protein YacL